MASPWLLLASVPIAAAPAAEEPAAPLDSGLVRSVELEPAPGTWVQHFRMDREGAGPDELPLGLLRYVAGPDREGGVQVDLELRYLAEDLRVFHTEQASPLRRRLVFREVRERAGRTLFLEGTSATGFEGYELGGPEVVRHERSGGGEFPLLLIESARLGLSPPGEAAVLDPLAARFEPVKLELREGAQRAFEARRADGSLRWRVSVRGEELAEWRFQERGPVARAISRAEFESLREQHELGARAACAAAASAGLR